MQHSIAENRKARFHYYIDDTLETGIILTGSEVKSMRQGQTTIAEAHVSIEAGEAFLLNAHIPEYKQAGRFNHTPLRRRKLLLHKRELVRFSNAVQRRGMTLVPLRLYFQKGKVKLMIGLARGKKLYDKRAVERQRDWSRHKQRLLREKQ